MNGSVVRFFFMATVFMVSSCAFDVVKIKQQPVQVFQKNTLTFYSFILDDYTEVNLGTGYKRSLKKDARWDYAGSIPQGDIFKTNDQILTVEASNIYEAYIVVLHGALVGFYLPAEKTFSRLEKPVRLNLTAIN